MVKRLISADTSEILKMSRQELKKSIQASEGRVVLSENVAGRESFIGDITNAEIAKAFGADLILLNGVDVFEPTIFGLDVDSENVVNRLHELVGCPIGVNLEPVDLNMAMLEERLAIPLGRQANQETFERINQLNFDFVCLTGNPGTGVSNRSIIQAIKLAKQYFDGLIIAGKMHGAGSDEAVVDLASVTAFIDAGADVILVPAVGTVPGFDMEDLKAVVRLAHQENVLVMSTIGTSQESSAIATIQNIALQNKIAGVDIQHIGDAGYGGVAPVENIYEMSKVLRGMRHTVSRMARSIKR
ncbi:MAG TPA: haloacid dehalogenase-like hydrolase [Enterococcus columbae]|nr:haloacid dehalogenase-like hydrolase [Enterococcus columbae]